MNKFETKCQKKKYIEYNCEKCHYNTCNIKDYRKHILTQKHINWNNETNETQKSHSQFNCSLCDKIFKSRTTLWRHRKYCNCKKEIQNLHIDNLENMKNIIDTLVQQNKEDVKLLMNTLIDQNNKSKQDVTLLVNTLTDQNKILQQQITLNNTTNNVTQTNNFNLNLFLNEQCKNAMNITDFLNTVQIEVEDVANVGKLGYVEGITRIFTKALNNLDIYERPIHCSDLKREVLYVKDNGIWEKEGEDKNSLKKAVQVISHKNVMKIKAWTDANPTWKTHYSKEEDEYLKISYESMGGTTSEEDNKYFNKIIRKIASNVTIDKDKCKK